MSKTISICKSCDSLNNIDSDKALMNQATCGKCGKPIELHGLVTEVNSAQLDRIISKSDVPVLVDFWASWCGPCKIYGPVFIEASKLNKNAIFLKVNTEENPEISSKLGIRGIPTTIAFKNGKEYRRQSGALPIEMVSQLIE